MFKFSLLCALVYASVATAAPAAQAASDPYGGSATPLASTGLVSFPLASPSAPIATATGTLTVSIASTPVLSTLPPAQGTGTSAPPAATSTASGTATVAGAPSAPLSAVPEWETVEPIGSFANAPVWDQGADVDPEGINGELGASIIAPENVPLDQMNPDFIAPPTTDSGSVMNAKWPLGMSHNRLQSGGWARQQNLGVLPIATAMASVNMRLAAGAVRELHWHSTAEWAFVLKGMTQVTAVNPDGQIFIDTVGPGDLWYFPAGIPHSLQATDDDPDGSEFILVFDDGNFSEDSTFQLTDWLAHVPREILAKNFQVNTSAFDHIPSEELYIFPAAPPKTDTTTLANPNGAPPNPFTFKFSQVEATPLSGGSVKVVDTRTFNISKTISGALVTVEPGAIRELHWHPTQPEWSYFLQGNGRMTLFASSGNARTFDYTVGDIGYVPPSYGHYVENTGNTTLSFLEIFNSDLFEDISLQQWLALTPPELVKAHLGFDDMTIAHLNTTKQTVVGPVGSA